MGQTYALWVAMLKEFYGSTFQETFNNEVLLKKYLETSNKQPFDGLRYTYPVHTGRNTGVGARAEGDALPTAGYQGYSSAFITAAYVYGRINLTGQVMAASKKTAFADAMSKEMEGVKTDLMFDIGRQCYGEGLGILAECYASASEGVQTAGTSQSVRNQYMQPGQPGARYLEGVTGKVLTIGTIANGTAGVTNASATVLSGVTIAANSGTVYDSVHVTGSSLATSGTGFFVFGYNSLGAGIELKGLRAIVDNQTATNCYGLTGGMYNNDTIFSVDRGGIQGWNAYIDQNSGTVRVLDGRLMRKTFSAIKKRGGNVPDIMFGEYDVIDAFEDTVISDRRFATKNFDAGVDSLTFDGKTFVKDLQAPYNELFCLYKPAIKWYVLHDLAFDDTDGSPLKNVAGYDKNEAFVKFYGQIAPGEEAAPNTLGVIRDVKTSI